MSVWLDKLRNKLFGEKKTKFRTVHVGNKQKVQSRFLLHTKSSNTISTARYSILFFIPKNLLEQFLRFANFYFLLISLIQLFTDLSPIGSGTTLIPLAIVVLFQMIKDAIEDIRRRIADNQVNFSKCLVFRSGKFQEIFWKNVRVGDVLLIKNNSPFPADLVFLSSSNNQGLCYVETAQLDGETNLKVKQAIPITQNLQNKESDLNTFEATITCDAPNPSLYTLNGNIDIAGEKFPITQDNQLLRGSSLRNTDWIVGAVIYTGNQTKLMKNLRKPPHKWSFMESKMNRMIIFIFLFVILLSIFGGIMHSVWETSYAYTLPYISPRIPGNSNNFYSPFVLFLRGFVSFFILLNTFIPISLYVTVEIVKILQAKALIEKDRGMYDKQTSLLAVSKTTSLNEDLGAIEYLFTDKTGTLTRNDMKLIKVSIGGTVFGEEPLKEAKDYHFKEDAISNGAWRNHPQSQEIYEFFLLLAVCNSVIPKIDSTGITYEGSSPDELAFVEAAKLMGFELIERQHHQAKIKLQDTQEVVTLTVLNIFEFDASRKRMSIICRMETGKVLMFVKGADTVLSKRIISEESNSSLLETTNAQIHDFAVNGYRTLLFAKKELNEEMYIKWNQEHYRPANLALENRTELLTQALEILETDLNLLGATAIEDRLQDQVPETISLLQRAGIKIFILTGDRKETSINIGMSSTLINAETNLIFVDEKEPEAIRKQLSSAFAQFSNFKEHCIVIDGEVLDIIFVMGKKEKHIKKQPLDLLFFQLCCKCVSVICYRVSPLQKAHAVQLIRRFDKRKLSLAIGDGANDVSMIQEANVGIGVSGREGMAAARASDYSISQFRFLQRLLLVHGRYSFLRTSKVIFYSFYKNAVVNFCQFIYQFFVGFSGATLFDPTYYIFYNLVFTAIPVIVLGCTDRDVSPKKSLEYPELYKNHHFFTYKRLIMYLTYALYHAAVLFFIAAAAFVWFTDSSRRGPTITGVTLFGMAIYFNLVILVNWKVYLEAMSLNGPIIMSVLIEIIVWIVFIIVYNLIVPYPVSVGWSGLDGILLSAYVSHGEFFQLARLPLFWLYSLLVLVAALAPEVLYKFVKKIFFSLPSDVVMRYDINSGIRKKSKQHYQKEWKRQHDIEAGLALRQNNETIIQPTASILSKA